MAAVLTRTGSLTRFLERHYGMRLVVRVHDQFVDRALAPEAALLLCEHGAQALRRRVSLLHRNAVMFDAESVLPLAYLPADLLRALEKGGSPLGNLLLDRGLSLSRSDLCVARIKGQGLYGGCWARRSVLRSDAGTRALVVEVFRPEIWQRIAQTDRRFRT
jgi:4-hydroxybenzoate synthetase (chorismate lyase)